MKIPRTLGRYEVVDLIGRGGMGALYRARDPRIGRFVAIKQLRPEFDTPELRDRFSREAAAAGSLSHPNIVTIFDVGEDDGLPFIAMEYVRGETFSDVLGLRPPLSVPRKLQLMEEVCAGLAHAHEAGIVHRDIKPANLIVGSEGTVKILDFGIAKLTASGMTLPGVILGTLNYMAPEQVRGEAVDARADIFAVGAVLYELLTHQQAFPGRATTEVLDRILNGAPKPIAEYFPEVDSRLVDLVQFALEKDRDRRIQEISSLQKELANIRLKPSVGESHRPSTRRSSSRQRQTGLITPPPSPLSGSRQAPPPSRELEARRAQIEQYLIAAEHELEAGNYDAAIESCKQVLMLDDSDERAIAQLDRIHAAFDEQQALAEQEADERQAEAERIGSSVDDARRRFARGEHQTALKLLEALEPASHTVVAETLEELRTAFRNIEDERRASRERAERRQRVVEALTAVRAAIQGDRLDEAAQLLERLRDIEGDTAEVSDVAERLRRAQAAARVKAELDIILRDFDDAFTLDDMARAGEILHAAERLAPHEPRVEAARQRVEQAVAARVAKEAAEARAREVEQRLAEAGACFEAGDLAGTGDKLKLAAALAPQEPRVAELSTRLREALERRAAAEAAERLAKQIADLIVGASQRLQSAGERTSELVLALRDVDQALELGPANAEALTLKASIEAAIAAHREAAKVKAVINNARARFANGKRQAGIRLLEEFQPASHPEITAALDELRAALQKIEEEQRLEQERLKRQERLAQLFADAQSAAGEQRFDAALDILATAATVEPDSPELARLRERIEQEQVAARLAAELNARLADFHARFAAGEFAAATEAADAAAVLAPTDERVKLARREVEQAIAARDAAEARAKEIADKHAAAQALFEQGDLQGAQQLLKGVQGLGPADPQITALSDRVDQAIKEKEEVEAARKRHQTVEDLVAAAGKRLQSTERDTAALKLAVQEVDQALTLEPEHAGAIALKATAQAAMAAEQEAAVIRASIRNARTRFANGKHHAAIQLLETLDPVANPAVAETLKELREALVEIEERRRLEQERAERQRQTALLIGTARVAIKAGRFTDALDALSAARVIDPSAEGLAELNEQALRGQADQSKAPARPAGKVETESDDDATRFIMLDPKDDPRRIGEVEPPPPAVTPRGRAADDQTSTIPALQSVEPKKPASRTWLWIAIAVAVAAIVFFLVLAALFRQSRPASIGTYPIETDRPNSVWQFADGESGQAPAWRRRV